MLGSSRNPSTRQVPSGQYSFTGLRSITMRYLGASGVQLLFRTRNTREMCERSPAGASSHTCRPSRRSTSCSSHRFSVASRCSQDIPRSKSGGGPAANSISIPHSRSRRRLASAPSLFHLLRASHTRCEYTLRLILPMREWAALVNQVLRPLLRRSKGELLVELRASLRVSLRVDVDVGHLVGAVHGDSVVRDVRGGLLRVVRLEVAHHGLVEVGKCVARLVEKDRVLLELRDRLLECFAQHPLSLDHRGFTAVLGSLGDPLRQERTQLLQRVVVLLVGLEQGEVGQRKEGLDRLDAGVLVLLVRVRQWHQRTVLVLRLARPAGTGALARLYEHVAQQLQPLDRSERTHFVVRVEQRQRFVPRIDGRGHQWLLLGLLALLRLHVLLCTLPLLLQRVQKRGREDLLEGSEIISSARRRHARFSIPD
mmetsp:Transcript_20685/g.64163  ORF Transcript_20685/g.64163 Transcript_20685/m.64163 type:complete len:425 (-) Transcript_20685:256-1530(-)